MPRLFIIGGSDAGISAALRARELAPNWHVTVGVADRYPNFSICGIPYYLSREVAVADNLAHRKAIDIQALGVELLLDHKVERIEPGARRVAVRNADGAMSEQGYDKLVIGTGAKSVRPPITGLEARALVDESLKLQPTFTLSVWAETEPYKSQIDLDHMLEGMRKAGLPE